MDYKKLKKGVDNFFSRVYYHKHEGNGVFEVNTLKTLFAFFYLVNMNIMLFMLCKQ